MRRRVTWLTLSFALLASACGTPPAAPTIATVSLSFENLVPISRHHGHYEAWAVLGSEVRSLGKFLVSEEGSPRTLDGSPISAWTLRGNPRAVTEIRVTQELPGDQDAIPNKQEFLRGQVKGGKAVLEAPLPRERYLGETGSFLLDNPVSEDPTDFNGVWFSKLQGGAYVPGLSLGEAPDGWMYAGWVIYQDKALRMGRFYHRALNDDWAGYSGRDGSTPLINPAGSPQPGEDFITNLPDGISAITGPDLAEATVIVSLENAAMTNAQHVYPSPVRIFTGQIPADPRRQVSYPLENVVATQVPSGLAVIQ